MKRSQANRSVIAARAANRPTRSPGASPSTNPAARVMTTVKPSGAGIRRRKAKMTGAQRNSEGRRSEWSMSPEFFTDPKWSRTVRECE